MEKIKLEVEVAKEAHELGVAVKNIVLAVKKAVADGVQVSDLGVVVSAAIAELPKALEGISNLDDEAKGDPLAFSQALAIPVGELVSALLKKDA